MTAYIRAQDLVVQFVIYNSTHRSLKNTLISAATGGRVCQDASGLVNVCALDGVNFEIREGDRVGLWGHNGAGKTTLLRVLGGVYEPVSGTLERRGRITSLLDIGLGMDPEASGYENILLRGLMMGMSKKEIDAKTDAIAEFSELGAYLDMPMRTYSAGMNMRLAFAIATSIQPDILLMDEWLSAGDQAFITKAQERMHQMVQAASIMVLASHSKDLLKSTCNKIFHLEHGKITISETL